MREPVFLQRRSTDEYHPRPYAPIDRRVIQRVRDSAGTSSGYLASSRPGLGDSRLRTAAGLRALNTEWGAQFYDVPEEACASEQAARDHFNGPETVVDVQTHFLPPGTAQEHDQVLEDVYRAVMPDWWAEMDGLDARDIVAFVTAVFLETENAAAILTSGPIHSSEERPRGLRTEEMAKIREYIDGFAGPGRLLNHALVHAEDPRDIEAMEEWRDSFAPVGWKVYTMGHRRDDLSGEWVGGYQLDDESFGMPFLERALSVGVPLVCVHKGLSGFVYNGSPRDIGPAAKAFPEIRFLVYHSGFEFPAGVGNAGDLPTGSATYSGQEGPYQDDLADVGVNRLIHSLESEGVLQQGNVFAELGTTWFCLIRRPREAAHVLGKLIKYLGEDNVIWGTDSIWYGAAQPLIDAFRVFQIPDDMCATYGYAKISPEVRSKILGGNAARVYGLDLPDLRRRADKDDLAWCREILGELRATPFML